MTGTLGRVHRRTQRGRVSFYVDFRPVGRIYTLPDPTGGRPMPILERAIAERVLESVRAAVADGKTLENALASWIPRLAPNSRFGARYDLWIARMEERVASGEIAASYVTELRRYGRPGGYLDALREVPVRDLSYGHLDDLAAELARRGLAAKTRRHVLATVRTFLRWLRRRGDVDAVPEIPVVSVPEHVPRLLSPELQRAVLDAIPSDRRGIFLALAYHGLRPSEAARLDVADCDFSAGELRPWRTKTKRSRVIPCSDELRGWLAERVPAAVRLAGGPLFRNPRSRAADGRWSVDALELTWRVAARAVGAQASLYEGTKHSSATAARRRGVALETIQAALGHADRRSTEKYARAAELAPVEVLQGALVSRSSLAGPKRRRPAPK